MKSLHLTLAAAAIVALAATVGAQATSLKSAALTPQAKVSLAVARITALKARPGKITDQELEKEKGGSGLRYSFDITSHGKPYEVGVDARTGVVIENIAEGRNPD